MLYHRAPAAPINCQITHELAAGGVIGKPLACFFFVMVVLDSIHEMNVILMIGDIRAIWYTGHFNTNLNINQSGESNQLNLCPW